MADTYMNFFLRPADESPDAFGKRMRECALELAANTRATAVIAFADDGDVGAPPRQPSPRPPTRARC